MITVLVVEELFGASMLDATLEARAVLILLEVSFWMIMSATFGRIK